MDTHQAHAPDSGKLLARDRVLLYTRGMDIEPEEGVGFALESLRRAGRNAGPVKVMEELFGLLREKNDFPAISGGIPDSLTSVPPLNRRTLLPKKLEPFSLFAPFAKWYRRLFRLTGEKDAARNAR